MSGEAVLPRLVARYRDRFAAVGVDLDQGPVEFFTEEKPDGSMLVLVMCRDYYMAELIDRIEWKEGATRAPSLVISSGA